MIGTDALPWLKRPLTACTSTLQFVVAVALQCSRCGRAKLFMRHFCRNLCNEGQPSLYNGGTNVNACLLHNILLGRWVRLGLSGRIGNFSSQNSILRHGMMNSLHGCMKPAEALLPCLQCVLRDGNAATVGGMYASARALRGMPCFFACTTLRYCIST